LFLSLDHEPFSRESCNLSILYLSRDSRVSASSAPPCLPTMNPRELVDHIRSGPASLVLGEPLRFRRRTRSNPCDFNEFLQALRSSETIRDVQCKSHVRLGISEDEWVHLVKTLGSIQDIQHLELCCRPGSSDFHPFQAVAEAVQNAQSLRKLIFLVHNESFPRDPSGMIALANALRERTTLQEFVCIEFGSPIEMEAVHTTPLDPVLRALPACPHLQLVQIMTKCASADAIKNLLVQLHSATDLRLVIEKENWLAVANEIRHGRCNVQRLTLAMLQGARSDATEAVKAVASAIRQDQNLEHLLLGMENGFTDEGCVALAEALTVNKTLRHIHLSAAPVLDLGNLQHSVALGVQAYKAFAAMLRVNTSLVLELPPFQTDGADERLLECRNQMHIERRLNQVGRGRLLSSSLTTREEYVDALHELNTYNPKDPPTFQVSCVYSLLRLDPSVVSVTSS
jgi:hypothetical protein